jgi:hypothetical protein
MKSCQQNYMKIGLVVRVPRYRPRGPGFDSQRYDIFWVVVCPERVHSAAWR